MSECKCWPVEALSQSGSQAPQFALVSSSLSARRATRDINRTSLSDRVASPSSWPLRGYFRSERKAHLRFA